MINTHEVNLSTSAFNRFTTSDYIILQEGTLEIGDYVLFKQIETVDSLVRETGLHCMTQIKEIIKDEGLKSGYILAIVRKM